MKLPSKRQSRLSKIQYQILCAAVVIAIDTAVAIVSRFSQHTSIPTTFYTAIMCFLATLFSTVLIRSISRYPGVEESTYIMPSMFVGYGVLMLILIMLRIPYSRFLLISSFVLSSTSILIIYVRLHRENSLKIGVVPEGDYSSLVEIPTVSWSIIRGEMDEGGAIDAVSADLWHDLSDEWERRLALFALQGIPVYDVRHLKESLTGKVQIERLSQNNFGTLNPLSAYMQIKMLLDWVAAAFALIILSPVLVLVAILIKYESPGPAIFSQDRIGYRGKSFRVYKFRTMMERAASPLTGKEAREAAMTKNEDRRITRVGRFLRFSRIDELPQLANVIKGDMSWIGPRPEAKVLSRWYEEEIPFYRYRHIVRPGITGWAQVNQGHVVNVDEVTEKLHFDFYYIKNFSFWIDVVILARTIRTVFTGFGAR